MRLVDRAQTAVRVVVRVHAETERFVVPHRFRAPVVTVVAEAVHPLRQALLLHLRLLDALAFLLPLAFLLQPAACFAGQLLLIRHGAVRRTRRGWGPSVKPSLAK